MSLVIGIIAFAGFLAAGIFYKLYRSQWFWGIVAIILLLSANLIKDPGYLSITYSEATGRLVGNLIDILRWSAPIMLIAVGMVLVIATRGIDLSVGSSMVAGGAAAMQFLSLIKAPDSVSGAAIAVLLAILTGVAIGAINGLLVTYVGLQPFITTLVMMMAGRGIAKVITGGQNTSADSAPFKWLVNGTVLGFPVVILIALAIVTALALFVRRTAFGLVVESVGINPSASWMAGIRPNGILLTVYILSGVLAAIGGVFAVGSVMVVDISGTGYQSELDAILAVVVGGTSLAGGKFSIRGAVVGALLIATLDKTVLFLGISGAATPAFKAVVIVLLCLLQSQRVRNLFTQRRSAATAEPAAAPKASVAA